MAAPSLATLGRDAHAVRFGSERGLSLDRLPLGQPILPGRRGGIADRWGDGCRGRSVQKGVRECVLTVAQPPANHPTSETHRNLTDREATWVKPREGMVEKCESYSSHSVGTLSISPSVVASTLHLLRKARIDRAAMPKANESRLLTVPMVNSPIRPDSQRP
jgi:hypothetical protein